jgi:hypothetical protein
MMQAQRLKYGTATGLALSFSALMFLGFSGGITDQTRKTGSGCTCHNPTSSSSVTVGISGPDTITVGQTGTFRVTVKGGPLASAGTDIAVARGVLATVAGQGLQKIGSELTHTSPKTPTGDSVSFVFLYTAPSSPGEDSIFANGNSVNLSGDNTGDQWNFAPQKRITIRALTAVAVGGLPGAYALEQNYPNPFNPSTTIRYALASAGFVRLNVIDMSGRQVASLLNGEQAAGMHSVIWSPDNLSSGSYFYVLESGDFRETRKALFVK